MSAAAALQQQAASNRRAFAACVALVAAVLAAVGLLASLALGAGAAGLGFGLGVAVLLVGFAPGLGQRSALRAVGAAPADPARWPRYHNLVEGLAGAGGLRAPALYVAPSPAANAFAVGRSAAAASLVATSGLFDALNRVELEGVLAHELAHVQSGAARLAALAVALPPLRPLALPPRRELDADEAAARLTRYPPGLASALAKLAAAPPPPGGPAVRPLWTVAPGGAQPTVAERIAALGEL